MRPPNNPLAPRTLPIESPSESKRTDPLRPPCEYGAGPPRIPACAGMTEGWEWRKSLKWSGVRTSESMVTVRTILNTVALRISPRKALRRQGAEGGRCEHLGENSHLRVRSRFIPAQAGIHASWRLGRSTDVSKLPLGDQAPIALAMPSDRMDSCLRRNDGRLGMAQVVEMVGRADFGVDGDRAPPAPTELILNTVALSLISPRSCGGRGDPRCSGDSQDARWSIHLRTQMRCWVASAAA